MLNVIDRATEAISSYIDGKITYQELADSLDKTAEYCSSFEEETTNMMGDDINRGKVGVLCSEIYLQKAYATYDAINDKYGLKLEHTYSDWEKVKNEIDSFKQYFK